MPSKEEVIKILERVRPALQMDGGDLTLVDVDEKNGIVKISFQGACSHCGISDITLKHLIEQELRTALPEIKEVQTV